MKKVYLLFVILSLCMCACADKDVLNGGDKSQDSLELEKITILHTNDIHGQHHPMDYKTNFREYKDLGGTGRRATLINNIRKETNHRVFLFDIGDISGRGEYDKYFGEPEIKIMNYLKYDAMVAGNAEFKLTRKERERTPEAIEVFKERIKEASFPVLTANVYDNKTGKRAFTPYVIFVEDDIRIAAVGMTTLKCRTYPECENLTFTDPREELEKIFKELEGKYDIFILLSHLGDLPDGALVNVFPQIDIIIEGDYHTFRPWPRFMPRKDGKTEGLGGTLICQTGELGIMLGKLDLEIDKKTKKIKSYDYHLLEVSDKYKEDPKIEEILKDYKINENHKPKIIGRN